MLSCFYSCACVVAIVCEDCIRAALVRLGTTVAAPGTRPSTAVGSTAPVRFNRGYVSCYVPLYVQVTSKVAYSHEYIDRSSG